MKPLRIAFLVDDLRVPKWLASIISDVMRSKACELVTVATNGSGANRRRLAGNPFVLNPFRFAQVYEYVDKCIFRLEEDALEPVDLQERLIQCAVVNTEPMFDGPYFRFTEADRKRLERLDLDVLLLFWSGLPTQEVLGLARHGVWSFLESGIVAGEMPIGFWEVLNNQDVTIQCLQVWSVDWPHAMTLHRHYAPTDRRSIARSRNNLLWKSVPFVSRKLEQLHRGRSLSSLVNTQQCSRAGTASGDSQAPSNVTMVKRAISHVTRFVVDRAIDLRYLDQWAIAYRYMPQPEPFDSDIAAYRWIIPPADRFWADPFPVQTKDGDFLFFEEFRYSERKGHLSVAAINRDGLVESPRILLRRDYHLSYPFIFCWNGEWFLVPETQDLGRIDAYKFDSFPYQVSHYKTLMAEVNACDTTLFEAEGRWWMFTVIASHGTWNVDELFLFHSDNPFGPWTPHPQNPVKSDVRSARPAGRVFSRNGKLYRPAQDCSRRYGYAVRVHEIQMLSEEKYAEQEVNAILPDWSPDIVATHTLNVADTMCVIDAKRRRARRMGRRAISP